MKHFDFIVSELTEKEYYATRSAYLPKAGETLMNHGGFPVTVLNAEVNGWHDGRAFAVVLNPRSGWVCEAHGIGKYIDGRIDWDGSVGIGFLPELKRAGMIAKAEGVLSFAKPKKRVATAPYYFAGGYYNPITCTATDETRTGFGGKKYTVWEDEKTGETFRLRRVAGCYRFEAL